MVLFIDRHCEAPFQFSFDISMWAWVSDVTCRYDGVNMCKAGEPCHLLCFTDVPLCFTDVPLCSLQRENSSLGNRSETAKENGIILHNVGVVAASKELLISMYAWMLHRWTYLKSAEKLMGQNPGKKTGQTRDHWFLSYPHQIVRSSTLAIVTTPCATNIPGGQMETLYWKVVIVYGMFKLYETGCTDCCFLPYELLSSPEMFRLRFSWPVHVMGYSYCTSLYMSNSTYSITYT